MSLDISCFVDVVSSLCELLYEYSAVADVNALHIMQISMTAVAVPLNLRSTSYLELTQFLSL